MFFSILNFREIKKVMNESEVKDYSQLMADTLREPVLILDNRYRILAVNDPFCERFDVIRENVHGELVFDLQEGCWDISALRELLESILPKKRSIQDYNMNIRSADSGELLVLVNASLLKNSGQEDSRVLLSFHAVIEQGVGERSRRFLEKNFRDILIHAPAMICMLRGPEHIFEVANERYYQLVGNRTVIGKTVREALPEVKNQGFFEILDEVYTGGKPYYGKEVPLKLDVGGGATKSSYVDFLYQPTLDAKGEVDGIYVHAVDVTEQVLAREKVRENEERLTMMIDTVPAIIWITDREGESIFLNKNWYRYTGQVKKEAAGYGWSRVVHPEDREAAVENFKIANAARQDFSATFRVLTKSGAYRWVIDKGNPKFNSKGEYEGMIGTVVDIHEEKVKEQLLKEKEHRIRSIVEEATVATAVYTGIEMKIELANEAMIELWGKDSSVRGRTLREALPELKDQPFHHLLEEVYTTGEMYWGKEERVNLEIDGRLQTGYYNFNYKPLRNEKGEIYGILNMAQDVTEIVRSREVLKESEAYFRQMADLMPEKVSNADPDGNFNYFNQNWLDYTGLKSEELRDKFWEIVHPEDRKEVRARWQHSVDRAVNFEMEIRLRNKEGRYKWHLSRAEAVKDQQGAIQKWITINTQIQKLKEEEKRKEDFLKMVSHELKTPVTSIKGYVQLLLSILNKEDSQQLPAVPLKPSLERIDHQIVRLTRLISEMLDLSRIEENKLELQKERFSLNELVNQTVQDINYTNTQHEIEVIHDHRGEVYADKDRIGQVLINFITNAIKYSPESQYIQIQVKKAGKEEVCVSVKDRGIGIAKENHKKIFKRFYRIGVESKETYAGFGIGLYLANEIIERHKGYIEIKSEIGRGSEFSFTLTKVLAPEKDDK